MTLDDFALYDAFWQRHPPADVLVAGYLKYKPPKTAEEEWREGAMNPAEAVEWFQRTGGKIPGVGRG